MSHYVDGQLRGDPGFHVPDGLRRDRDAAHRAQKEKRFVRKPGRGKSVEWKSNRVRSVHSQGTWQTI